MNESILVTVSTDLEVGTDRGGEDLYLMFSGTLCCDGDPDVSKLEVEVRLDSEEDVDVPEDENEEFCLYGGGEYDFKWEGSLRNLKESAEELVRDPKNWSRNPGSSSWKFSGSEFVHGNAD